MGTDKLVSNAIFSIRNLYTESIFNGIKTLEFRNVIGKELGAGSKIFIYETKKRKGYGKVIGSVEIESIIEIEHKRLGTYFLLPYYIEQFGNFEEKEAVKKAMEIHLDSCDDSLVLYYLFHNPVLDYLKKHKKSPDTWSQCEFFDNFSQAYREKEKRARDLMNHCDEWARKIGYYDKYGISDWKYAIKLKNPYKFIHKLDITEFKGKNGYLKRPPQSWCYTLHDVCQSDITSTTGGDKDI